MTRHGARAWPATQAVLGATCISASAVLFTLANVTPLTAAFYRCALPLPVLAVLAAAEQQRHGPRPRAHRGYAALAGLFLAVNLVLWIHAIKDVGAGPATVLGNMQVLFVAVLAWALLRERPDRLLLVTLPAVLLGVVLVSGMIGQHGTGPRPVAGVAFGLATSAAYACFLLILRHTAGQTYQPAGQLFDATAGAAAGALVFGMAFGGLQLAIPWRSLIWLLVLTLTSGITGWLLVARSLAQLSATTSAMILLLEPAGALVLAAIVLGQRPGPLQIGGAVLVCGAVLLVAWSQSMLHQPEAMRLEGLGEGGLVVVHE
ncbi:MAG TPA: DMT family transporter [Streptosporangiaceae bacterium]|nr:DMT family transporter [Streptosporangiaceae bacterium]